MPPNIPPKIHSFYQAYWGDRWPSLAQSLEQSPRQIVRTNLFTASPETITHLNESPLGLSHCSWATTGDYTQIERHPDGLLQSYIMDPGSAWIAHQLPLNSGDHVLDLCAAPGGKTLILAERQRDCEITANEPHPQRRQRLIKNIRGYLPQQRRNLIWVTGRAGGLFAKSHPEKFDAILIDAPCSGERFLWQSPGDLAAWTPQRSARLAQEQYALLTAGLLALKPGGFLLFSTCSLSPLENETVIERLLTKKTGFTLCSIRPTSFLESAKHGYWILPDHCGFGPFYLTLIQKKL